jgi:hypothetical protein
METDFFQTFIDLIIELFVATLQAEFSEFFGLLEILQSLGLFV